MPIERAILAVGFGEPTRLGSVAAAGDEHGIGVTKGCLVRCAGETTYCTNTLHFLDDYDDAIEILQVWDEVVTASGVARIPAVGNLPIIRVIGNGRCTNSGGDCDRDTGANCTLPCLLGNAGSTAEQLPGSPTSGKVRFAQTEYRIQDDDPTPLTDTVFFEWRDLCNSGAGDCGLTSLISPAGSSSAVASCDDQDACTEDTCSDGKCTSLPVCESDGDCDDEDACTTDVCTIDGCCDYPVGQPLTCDVSVTPSDVCDDSSRVLCASTDGGSGDHSLSWELGEDVIAACDQADIDAGECCVDTDETGTYRVTVRDETECTSTCEVSLALSVCVRDDPNGGSVGNDQPGPLSDVAVTAPAIGDRVYRQHRTAELKGAVGARAPIATGFDTFAGVGNFATLQGENARMMGDEDATESLRWFVVRLENRDMMGDSSMAADGGSRFFRIMIYETPNEEAPGRVIYEASGYTAAGTPQTILPID